MIKNKYSRMRFVLAFALALPLSIACFCNSAYAKEKGVAVTITNFYVELHTGPGRGYPIFHVVEKGDSLVIFKERTGWYKVRTAKGKVGWVKQNEIQATLNEDGSIVTFSLPGMQEFTERRVEVGILGGDFAGADGFTTYLGFHLTENIATEIKYTQAFGTFSNNKLVAVNITHQPFPHWRVSPFFTLGTGVINISPSSDLVQVEDRQDPILTVGGGFLIYVSRKFLFRLEYNDHKILTTRENNDEVEEWKAGFSVFF